MGDGITPAYAGKRLVCVRLAVLPQDHPRLCGEKRGCGAHLIIEKGSPPPMRGKAEGGAGSGCCRRITPAYAGKRHLTIQLVCTPPGSPPPMRGKVFSVCIGITNVRITPAYAGKRSISRSNLPLKRDHPRLCGEKLISLHKSSSERGSPPPMRGKVFFNDFSHGLLRITPAYAGKSASTISCSGTV